MWGCLWWDMGNLQDKAGIFMIEFQEGQKGKIKGHGKKKKTSHMPESA